MILGWHKSKSSEMQFTYLDQLGIFDGHSQDILQMNEYFFLILLLAGKWY